MISLVQPKKQTHGFTRSSQINSSDTHCIYFQVSDSESNKVDLWPSWSPEEGKSVSL